jgi:hypothetical protein
VLQSTNTLVVTQLNDSSKNVYVSCPETGTVLLGVRETVGVGEGDGGVYEVIVKSKPTTHAFEDGVGVGVSGNAVTDISTKSHGIDGVGVTNGTKSQSKYAVKSNVLQSIADGVGVGQGPTVNKLAEMSGHSE